MKISRRIGNAIMGAILGIGLSPFSVAAQDAPAGKTDGASLAMEECHIRGVESLARCGTFEVPEDHSAPGGKKIPLHVVVLPPSGGQPTLEPLYFFAGGPGQAASEQGVLYERILRRARQGRDLVIIDQRGTGKSFAFECVMPDDPMARGDTVARACLEDIPQNPVHYASDAFIKDVNLVREALGHETISLMGISYGTRAALLYAKAHEDQVRAMVLDSVAPPHKPVYLTDGRYAADIVEKVIEDCASDQDCKEAFPTLTDDFDSLLLKLAEEPANVRVPEVPGLRVDIGRDLFLLGFRGALYAPPSARLMPLVVSEAARDNFDPWLAINDFGAREIGGGINMGLMFSVQCAEEISIVETRTDDIVPSIFPSAYSLFWEDACSVWPRANVPDDFNAPVSVATPTLLLSGALDPITPPVLGDATAEHLSNSNHVIAPNAGHSVVAYGCASRLIGEFLDHADPAQIDGECLSKISKPAFTIGLFGPKP